MDQIVIKYNGFDADQHEIDLRLFGKSIAGFERIVTSGLVLFEHGRWIRKKEQLPILLKAKQPLQGSFELPVYFGHIGGVLPLLHEALANKVHEVALEWLSWVMAALSENKSKADPHFEALVALHREAMDRHERSDREQREFIQQTLDKSLQFAKDMVAPVGHSCTSIDFGLDGQSKTVVDVPTADKVRARKDTRLDDMKEYRIRIDGLTLHNRRLQVEFTNELEHFIPAEVRDPIYDSIPNPYLTAINDQSVIEVLAKAELKFGEISKLHIMEFVRRC
ncbi:MAG: hypothetical protein AB3N28_03085 [Kordiimonas sp.]